MEFSKRAGESNIVFRGDVNVRQSELEANSSGISESIQREIEKAQIREEILAAEMARRRELEAEVRRELMAERAGVAKVGAEKHGFSHYSSAVMTSKFKVPMRYELVTNKAPKMESKGALLLQSSTPTIPLVPQTATAKEVNPIISTSVGMKRKPGALATPVPSIKMKKWTCDLCNVSTPGESVLQEHLKGKKHKAKERIANSSLSLENFVPPESLSSMQGESSNIKEMGVIKNGDHAEVEVKQKEGRVKCWCQVCKFETDTDEEIISHMQGQKHKDLVRINGGCVIAISTMVRKECTGEKEEDRQM